MAAAHLLLAVLAGAAGAGAAPQGSVPEVPEAPGLVLANTSAELFYPGCETLTPGTCRFFGCKSSRGPTDCISGKCYCKPGTCLQNGVCRPPPNCQTMTPGTCRILGCKRSRGPTDCVHGKCICKPGYCVEGGVCMPPSQQQAPYQPQQPYQPKQPYQPYPAPPPRHIYTRHALDGRVCLRGWRAALGGRWYHCPGFCCHLKDQWTNEPSVQAYCRVRDFGRYKLEPCRPRQYLPEEALAAEPAKGQLEQPGEVSEPAERQEEEEEEGEDGEARPEADPAELAPPPLAACAGLAALAAVLLGVVAARRWRGRALGAQKEPLLAA